MARSYRFQGENCFYHITSRGDNRKKIFISDYDYKKFLEYLAPSKQIAIYLLKRFASLNNKEIGDIFKMEYHAISKAALNIERLIKENPGVKREVEEITFNFEV